ncbi:carbohydrate ABC transporter permease [Tessaracoccus sp. OH4464_COT-324]|uniref:carbohydrate ABC transporter permease n=1 Tax=Tessaracoccus sp. OH4464_COT-324 TaxID=2491059 RepID=UPI000F634A80|nr:carbohydrate ABC transporter permease [Tessaracoccus sp. OH4464_COT-324]RRD45196.1 carbohydrate ABC transporter permease [Tessaracoccus sp. OH4464_COT-324]
MTQQQERKRRSSARPTRIALYAVLIATSLVWLFPLLWALFNSFRDYGYTLQHGYLSFGGFTFDNYINAWERGGFTNSFLNSLIITLGAVILTLALSSCAAFVLARYSFRFNLTMLAVFVAANLLPPQSLLIPIYRMFRSVELPLALSDSGSLLDSHAGVILINVAFQTGFCTFVLSNYMKTLPPAIYESAMLDGASAWRQFYGLTLPLLRPPLAALATLQTAWIYNEFFWATVLMQTGDKYPVTSSLNNLKGAFFTDYNLLSAGSIIAALPVLLVFFVLQKQFVAGLTLGATKG